MGFKRDPLPQFQHQADPAASARRTADGTIKILPKLVTDLSGSPYFNINTTYTNNQVAFPIRLTLTKRRNHRQCARRRDAHRSFCIAVVPFRDLVENKSSQSPGLDYARLSRTGEKQGNLCCN